MRSENYLITLHSTVYMTTQWYHMYHSVSFCRQLYIAHVININIAYVTDSIHNAYMRLLQNNNSPVKMRNSVQYHNITYYGMYNTCTFN